VRKRTKAAREAAATTAPSSNSGNTLMDIDTPVEQSESVAGGALKDEWVYRSQERAELEALVDPSIKADFGASQTGLYDLVGALQLPS
jgi:ubiquitin carboxyl-terminal hydrolase 14